MLKRKKWIFILMATGLITVTISIPYFFLKIYQKVKNDCLEAQKEFNKDCVSSLIEVVKSENKPFRKRNSAVWALGQIADKKALPLLTGLSLTLSKQEKCKSDQEICKYEVEKAIKWCDEGNLTSWMYKNSDDW